MQVVLDCGQVAALVLAQDLTWLLPGWAVTGMSAALVTQSNTWQWVPFDCLLPVSSPSSGAAVQSLLIMVLPGEASRAACGDVHVSLHAPAAAA